MLGEPFFDVWPARPDCKNTRQWSCGIGLLGNWGGLLTALQVAGTEALQVPHTLLLEVAVVFDLLLVVEVAVVVGLYASLVVLVALETADTFDVSLEYVILTEELMVEVAEVVEFDDDDAAMVALQKF